jgi:hypothetical protein
MTQPDDAFAAAQRRRFARENAHLYVPHDTELYMQPAAYERWLQEREAKAAETPNAAITDKLKDLLQLKAELAALKAEIKFQKFLRKLHHWLTQPRLPAGTTGPLRAQRHGWGKEHVEYNRAVAEHFERFIKSNGIRLEDMTPEQARAFVQEIKRSQDHRIRDFNIRIPREEYRYNLKRIPRGRE